jgi:hypothetical protein
MVEGAVVEGIRLSVLELTGERAEAILMHPWLLHAPAPNSTRKPRFISLTRLCTQADTRHGSLATAGTHERLAS